MSTRIHIASVEGIHFYKDCFDDQNCFLEFDTCSFEAHFSEKSGRVSATIPIHVWEFLRTLQAAEQGEIAKTDDEIRTEMECLVDERIAKFKEGKKIFSGLGFFGDPATPREEQIQRGLSESIRRRDVQRQILAKTKELVSQHATKK